MCSALLCIWPSLVFGLAGHSSSSQKLGRLETAFHVFYVKLEFLEGFAAYGSVFTRFWWGDRGTFLLLFPAALSDLLLVEAERKTWRGRDCLSRLTSVQHRPVWSQLCSSGPGSRAHVDRAALRCSAHQQFGPSLNCDPEPPATGWGASGRATAARTPLPSGLVSQLHEEVVGCFGGKWHRTPGPRKGAPCRASDMDTLTAHSPSLTRAELCNDLDATGMNHVTSELRHGTRGHLHHHAPLGSLTLADGCL